MGNCYRRPRVGYKKVSGKCRDPENLQKQKLRRLATAQRNKEARFARKAKDSERRKATSQRNKEARSARAVSDAERAAKTKKNIKEFKEREQAIKAKWKERRSDRRMEKYPNGA
tara:strand:+ start:132 stop:473 length:342 start_codon:yes stop_codon:yes gene_type:complete